MKRASCVLVVLPIMTGFPLKAQESPLFKQWDMVRLKAPDCGIPERPLQFRGVRGDALVLRSEGEDLTCPMAAVNRLEVREERPRWNRGTMLGALIGGALGVVVGGLQGDREAYPVLDPRTAAPGLGIGALLGAGIGKGPRARKWMLIGTVVGAAGALYGLHQGDGMAGLLVLFLAPVPLGVGSLVGLTLPEGHWTEVSVDRLRPIAPGFAGGRRGLGVSIAVGR